MALGPQYVHLCSLTFTTKIENCWFTFSKRIKHNNTHAQGQRWSKVPTMKYTLQMQRESGGDQRNWTHKHTQADVRIRCHY